jgi:hypothetical protein
MQVDALTGELHTRIEELQSVQRSSATSAEELRTAAETERQGAAAELATVVAWQQQLNADLTECRTSVEQERVRRKAAEEMLQQHAAVRMLQGVFSMMFRDNSAY